jgi:regulator of protease activity HflC (stomatin/prohibitin superfamily)
MSKENGVVAIYKTRTETEAEVKELQKFGFNMKLLFFVGKDHYTDQHIEGYYSMGNRIRSANLFYMKRFLMIMAIGLFGVMFPACASVNSGMEAIEWTPSGGTSKAVLAEGYHFVSPLSQVYQYDLREQEHQEQLEVLANNGLSIVLDTSILYKPVSTELFLLQTEIGSDYYRVLLAPILQSGARKVVGRYTPEEIYSTKREEVEREILQEVTRKIQSRHLQVDSILIRDVHLPKIVQDAIERKLEQEQRALEMQFVLDRERKEADRKRIEAAGIADYQQIISKGLTKEILEWKEIEAIEKLSRSPNEKTIVLGGGKGGLPLILDAGTSTSVK